MKPKKQLGQHFLTAPSYAQKIALAVPAFPDENVLEIGPGKGAISALLKARFSKFHLVELDADVIPALSAKLGEGHWTLHHANVMDFNFAEAGFPLHAVGNLPYSIGALIIRKTLLYGNNIKSCTFMVQREVAERIAASPHNKQNGFLSIFCQFFGQPKILFHIPPGAFFPKPKVDSSVFQIIIRPDLESLLPENLWLNFFAMVDKGFKMRRKTLVNALDSNGSKARFSELLESLSLNPKSRAEDLGINEWLALYKKSCEPFY
jgi:16S rRNA (adenine1518-N6/adenine1519-N6)-dimethyltransferase